MKIISYNVNGIRAALNKGFIDWLKSADPDVICLQEIKAMEEQLDVSVFEEAGYPYHYWFSAQKKGYSGVAILCKTKPNHVEYGTGIASMDFEGRNIRVDFPARTEGGDNVSIMSLYLPSGTNDARLQHKFDYMDMFRYYIDELKKDIHNPKGLSNVSGFLPVEREWIGNFMNNGFIDSFRHFNKDPENYTWWSYRANSRARNKGWRLDYALVSSTLQEKLKRSVILSDAVHSDHCPILLEIED